MSIFISDHLASLNAYIPGEQPSDSQYIKLNTNESPYPPSPGVLAALKNGEVNKLNLYPNPDGTELIAKIASTYGVHNENVIIGNGSDELLAFSFLAFFSSGVIFPDVTYGFYPVYSNLFSIPYTQLPLSDDFSVNVEDYKNAGRNIVLANPNAPTGIALELNEIESIVKSNPNHLVLVDEAYIDFGGESAIPLLKNYENLLIIHTYSKARSMAGARLSYALASGYIINGIKKIKYSFNPYNVNRLTQVIGRIALDESDYYKQRQQEIIKTRRYVSDCLQNLGFVATNSKANFIFTKNPDISGEDLYLSLKSRGILVRHWNLPRISDYVRITIGTREHMDALCAMCKEILNEKKRNNP